ncbi:hypothetical protein [Thermus phage TSP4]|nr:hypothetical protein [Thermus phage TSP4]
MPYLPHSVLASVRDLAARIEKVRIRDKGQGKVPRYELYVDVKLTQLPIDAVIYGVKFYAPIEVVDTDNTKLSAPRGKYDELIDALLQKRNQNLKAVEEFLTSQMKHSPLMVQSVGGVWIISQI